MSKSLNFYCGPAIRVFGNHGPFLMDKLIRKYPHIVNHNEVDRLSYIR